MKYRLGLDVGTNSLGWSVIELDGKEKPCRIEAAGSRIFSNGRQAKSKSTLKAERRVARSARRRRDRFKQRQSFLIHALTKNKLLPRDKNEMKNLQILNPIELRAKALTEKIPPFHIGRALFHLNQRRGFQSNRKDRSEESTSGKVSSSYRILLEEMRLIDAPLSKDEYKKLSKEDKKNARRKEAENRKEALKKLSEQKKLTYGSFLWNRQQKGFHTRVRDGAGESGKLYDIYPQRELYKDEFNKIWLFQAKHHSSIMTDGARSQIEHAIFYQRPLKPQQIGKCSYLPQEDRTFRGMPSFQRYRIYQEVNNLSCMGVGGEIISLIDHPKSRDKVIQLLENVTTRSGLVVWSKIEKILKEDGVADGNIHFNLETPKRKGLDGNLTSKIMLDDNCIGKDWAKWSLEKQDNFIDTLIGERVEEKGQERYLSDEEVLERLQNDFGLSEYSAKECLNASAGIPDDTAGLSLKAARILAEKMDKDACIQPDAVQWASEKHEDFKNPYTRARDGEKREKLPYYGEAFQDGRHIIPGLRKEKDKHDDLKFFGGVTNPTVHIALNQIRQVVNELIDRYGHPYSISIELGRDLPAGEKKIQEIESEQRKNQEENEKLNKKLQEKGYKITPNNRLRLRLWYELDKKDPCGRRCPFSGDIIRIDDLFNGTAEVEHLIPFSQSLDDSRSNKTICTKKANGDKRKKTPFEAFSNHNDYNWNEIIERVKRLPKSKQWRFQQDAMEIWKRDHGHFLSRHLNDTRYIGRLAKEYLECICPFNKIDVLTGRLTALLRRHWGLNSVLNEDDSDKKNRDDHRHHAVDAIVVGMTTLSMLQNMSKMARKSEDKALERLIENRSVDPWLNFRKDVKAIVQDILVSHKPTRKKLTKGTTDGQLHNATAYGIIKYNENGASDVVVKNPIGWFDKEKRVKSIRDNHLRENFINLFKEGGKEAIQKFAQNRGIRSLRCEIKETVIPINDKDGNPYKAYMGDSNWGMEIYQNPGSKKWEGIPISRFHANQADFIPGSTYRPHPAAKMVMRLQINDCVEIEEDNCKKIMRLQKLSKGRLTLAEIHESNVDARNRDKDDSFKYLDKSANKLRELKMRKVHISPAGQLSYEVRK